VLYTRNNLPLPAGLELKSELIMLKIVNVVY